MDGVALVVALLNWWFSLPFVILGGLMCLLDFGVLWVFVLL